MSKYSVEDFLGACGATGPLRLSVEHPSGADRYLLHQPFAIVGRDSRADVRVADANSARRHLYLQVLGGRLLCLDLTKSSPDGRKQPHHCWMAAGTEVRLSSSTVRLLDAPGPLSARQVLPHITLSITGSATDTAELRIRHPIVLIGQAHECQVRLRDERVSRFHCALVNTTAGLWVVDLLGRGGVALNGELVRSARFDEGDELRIGGAFTIQLQRTLPDEQCATRDAPVVSADSLGRSRPESAVPALMSPADEPRPLVTLEGAGVLATADSSGTSMALAFARLQQQMAEQFHLTMTGVVDTFREMHRDQMRMVWQELARVQKLTHDLPDLKSQMHQLRTEPAARPRELTPLGPARSSDAASPVTPSDSPGKAGDARLPLPKAGPPSPRTAASASTRADVHEWLSGRVDAVQRERDGRWQKIFSLLSGSSPPAR